MGCRGGACAHATAAPRPRKSWKSLRFWLRLRRDGGLPGQPGARAEAELAVHAREVSLDGVHAHEHRRRDLLVGAPLRSQPRAPELGLGELGTSRPSPADAPQLVGCAPRPQLGALLLEDLERRLERPSCGAALARAAPRGAVREQRAPSLKAPGHAVVLRKCLVERIERRVEITVGSGEKPSSARGGPERPHSARTLRWRLVALP